MISFYEYLKKRNIKLPEGSSIPGSWFGENGIAMIVECTCCGMTMASPSAFIDEDGHTYCADCAGAEEE